MKLELLAPAQNKECAFAAINYGADAVYMGASAFGARKKVGNSISDIKEVVEFAHKFYAKVYCAVNTILDDNELQEAKKLIESLYEANVDAIIVQDMGILQLAIDGELPPIKLYASTQCDNRTLEKVKFFDNIGLDRVILARELSLKEIEEICANTKCEIETFVHGALCVSYSGQCYLSQSIGGRSANRGECAQPCRKKYTLVDDSGKIIAKDKHLLSLKDFNASEKLEKLAKIGVSSFKVEGRLKDETYVKNVVGYYRKKLDKIAPKISSGTVFFDFEPDVNKAFNRGFTEYFLEKRGQIFNFESPKMMGEKIGKVTKVGANYFEISGKGLNPQDGLYFNNTGCLVNKVEGKKIYPNKMEGITLNTVIFRNFDSVFEKNIKNSKTKRLVKVNLEVFDNVIKATDEDKNVVELDIPSGEIPNNPEKMIDTFKKQLSKSGESIFFVENIEINSGNIPFLPVSIINELRRTLMNKLEEERLRNYKKEEQLPLKYSKFPLQEMGYKANVHNSLAEKFYNNCGCKIIEKSMESTGVVKSKNLMTTKHCLKYAFNMCGQPKKLFLIDEKNKKYELNFDCKNCQMQINNCD